MRQTCHVMAHRFSILHAISLPSFSSPLRGKRQLFFAEKKVRRFRPPESFLAGLRAFFQQEVKFQIEKKTFSTSVPTEVPVEMETLSEWRHVPSLLEKPIKFIWFGANLISLFFIGASKAALHNFCLNKRRIKKRRCTNDCQNVPKNIRQRHWMHSVHARHYVKVARVKTTTESKRELEVSFANSSSF